MKSLRFRTVLFVLSFVVFSYSNTVLDTIPDPDPQRFAKAIKSFEKWDSKNSFPERAVLFIGSSSIRLWQTHVNFPKFPVINRGFGGSHISDVQYYYPQVIKKYKPSIIVFYAGDNDVAAGKTADRVFEDYKELTGAVLKDNPGAIFIYIPIKPSINRWKFWPVMKDVNSRIYEFNKNNRSLYYIDLASPVIGKNGQPDKTLFLEDGLHLNEKGYKVWQSLLTPLLYRILK